MSTMNARDVILAELCTPACLLAMIPEGQCKCRCNGRGHGLLCDAEIDFPEYAAPRPADPFDCAFCGKRIGQQARHIALGPGPVKRERVICARHGETTGLHAIFWPQCQFRWHDIYDHPSLGGERGGIAWAIATGYWIPEREVS